MGCRDIDDCTSLDEDVQHNRTPLGDTHPLRGTGSVSTQSSEQMVITHGQPRYFGWTHRFRVTHSSQWSKGLSFANRQRLCITKMQPTHKSNIMSWPTGISFPLTFGVSCVIAVPGFKTAARSLVLFTAGITKASGPSLKCLEFSGRIS